MDQYIGAIKQYADFGGRARRNDFWIFVLINLVLLFITGLISDTIANLYALFAFIPNIAITARRLHDTGRSGWWQLLYFIPIIGLLILLVFWTQDSQSDNGYGVNPKASEAK